MDKNVTESVMIEGLQLQSLNFSSYEMELASGETVSLGMLLLIIIVVSLVLL